MAFEAWLGFCHAALSLSPHLLPETSATKLLCHSLSRQCLAPLTEAHG